MATAAGQATAKRLVLITGANGGIGYELAAQLMAKGPYHVLVGSRSAEKGEAALKQLQARPDLAGTAELVLIDVTRDDTIAAAAAGVERAHGRLDVLVNNAGVAAVTTSTALPALRQQLRDAFDANATGVAVVTRAFAPLLQKSADSPAAATTNKPRILNISSGAGSIGRRLEPTSAMYKIQEVQYRASKAALNMITACQWVEHGPAVKVFAYCPGFTVSKLGEHNTAANGAKPTAAAVAPIVELLEGARDAEAGLFLHDSGTYPW